MPFLAPDPDSVPRIRQEVDDYFKNGQLVVYSGWVCSVEDFCTCGGGGPESNYAHETACGLVPMIDLVVVEQPVPGKHSAEPPRVGKHQLQATAEDHF